MTDEELMQAIAKQDEQALTELVDRYIDALLAYAMRLGSSSSLAEDQSLVLIKSALVSLAIGSVWEPRGY